MLTIVRFWILLSTWLVSAGWILSALHQLNRAGYGVAFALTGVAAIYGWRKNKSPAAKNLPATWRKFLRRFRRPAPGLFLMLALLSLVSGVLHAPYDSDTNAYRFPRVLHWLGQEQWHWTHTADMRMNVAGCGYEWLITPILLFTRTDRFLFLVNWGSYLMLPGLIFCVFRFLGVRLRVAWWWAWLLASGWCYVMQSASVVNDGLGTIYALAAVALAMKARETGQPADFWLSLLAAALLTGVKQTSLPLAGLWLLAAWPERRIVWGAPKTFCVLAALAILVSGTPTIFFNLVHTGSWSGISALQAECPDWQIQLRSPFWGIVGNAFCLPVQNLLPPFFPWRSAWNHAMDAFITTPLGSHFNSFEHFGAVRPGISESSAGIGLAVVLMTLISLGAVQILKLKPKPPVKRPFFQVGLRVCPWILLVLFMTSDGAAQNARHLAAYYVFFFPLLLANAGHEKLVRQKWWQSIALLSISLSAGLLVVNTSRPLFPALTVTQYLAARHPHSQIFSTLHDAYNAPSSLQNAVQKLKEIMPANAPLVGYAAIGNAQLEPALWQPLGVRRVARVLKTDSPERLMQQGIHYVVIENYPSLNCRNLNEWMARYNASLTAELTFQEKGLGSSQSHVYLMRLDDK